MKEVSIIKAKYIRDYQVELTFNDGKNTIVDFKDFLENSKHPEITKYRNLDLFKNFKLVNGDLDWNDFDLTFPIWDLYTNNILKNKSSDEKEAS